MKSLKIATWAATFGLIALAAPVIAPAHFATAAQAAQSHQVTLYIFGGHEGIKGSDGKPHDTTVPSSFVVKAGETVSVTVINYDEGPHTITAPSIGLNQTIKGGKEVGATVEPVSTTFTFTAPTKAGVYRWYCALPCDAGHGYWAMTAGYGGPGQEGFMAGNIVVL